LDVDFTGTDRFVIERQLGAGSMGAVYLAYDRTLESRVALKTLLSVDPTAIYRFKKEFRALADVSHPNLVTLHELFSEGDQWFFTMEYVEGIDLLTFVHGGRRRTFDSTPRPISEHPSADGTHDSFELPVKGMEMLFPSPLEDEDRLRNVLEQVVEGLMAVHAAGKLHRDLKPENVLVARDGRAVLCDFGIITEQAPDIHETLVTVIGTPAYMSPEQCRGEGGSAATDWYALGVILYEALTGDVPFDGTPMQVIARKQEKDPPQPSDVVSGVPEDLNDLCMQLLDRDPTKRPDGKSILRALRSRRAASVPAPDKSAERAEQLETAFVGRDAQVRELEAALRATEAGHPVIALVSGPSGIGKTTLVNHFIESVAREHQAIVLKGRCYERESVPFKAFDNVIDTLSRYLRKLPAVDVARMLPREVDALAGLFPVLKRVEVVKRSRRGRALPPDPQQQRQRAFRALKEMFCRIADLEPLVVYVDDLQWSDVESAQLLSELVTGNDRPAMLLVCVYRESDSEHSPGLQALLQKLGTSDEVELRQVKVGSLSAEDSFTLARRLLGQETGEDGIRKLGFESAGNPHLLTQLARHVTERKAEGIASSETARGLVSFERVLSQRLSSLSSDARTLLELLSVAGRPVPEAMLTLVSSFNIDLPSALAELRSAKLVRGVASQNSRAVEVYHDTIREGLTSSMDTETMVGWHRRLAAALEASGAIDLEALTSHLLGAGERERASLYASRAAEQAEKGLAFEKAARLYGVAAKNAEGDRRRALLQRHADALVSAGRGAAAAESYFEAAQGAAVDHAMELRARGGIQLLLSGDLEAGLDALRKPLAAAGLQVPADFPSAAQMAGEAYRALRRRGFGFTERAESDIDEHELTRLDTVWGVTRGLLLHEMARPLPLLTRFVQDALDLGEPLRIVRGLALFHGHIDVPFSMAADTPTSGALDVAEAIARRLDSAEARAAIAFAKGLAVYHHGKVEQALLDLFRAEDLYRNHTRGGAFEMRQTRLVIAHLQTAVQRECDFALLSEWLREAEGRGDRISSVRLRMALATLHLQNDNAEAAASAIDEAARLSEDREGITAAAEMLARGRLYLYRGDPERARTLGYQLDEFFASPLAYVRLWRGMMLLLRARLSLISRASRDAPASLLAQAAESASQAAELKLPCLHDDISLVRAGIAAAEGRGRHALKQLDEVLGRHHDARRPPLPAIFALRAKGQLLGNQEGLAMETRADQLVVKRGLKHPRRYARTYVPLLEEAVGRSRTVKMNQAGP
jgi:hypothetical protein